MPTIVCRDYNAETDKNFVYSTWLRGLYYGNDYFREIEKSTFMQEYHAMLDALLVAAKVQVSCLSDEPDTIVGYIVYSRDAKKLHWAHTKEAWRGQGIFKASVPSTIETCSHITKPGNAIRKNKNWKFEPFFI